LANVGTAIVGVYATSIGLKQIPALQYRLTWKWTAAVVIAPVAFIAAFVPNWFMDNSLTYMYFLGLVFAPICGVQIVDYYFFRHQRVDMVSLRLLGEGQVLLLGRLQPGGLHRHGGGLLHVLVPARPGDLREPQHHGVQVAERLHTVTDRHRDRLRDRHGDPRQAARQGRLQVTHCGRGRDARRRGPGRPIAR